MRKSCAVVLCAWLVAPGAGACGMTSKLTAFEPVADSVPAAQADAVEIAGTDGGGHRNRSRNRSQAFHLR